jgi:hypothetical protein
MFFYSNQKHVVLVLHVYTLSRQLLFQKENPQILSKYPKTPEQMLYTVGFVLSHFASTRLRFA